MTGLRMLTVALAMAVLVAACGSSTGSGDNASTDTTSGRALDLGGQDGETTLPPDGVLLTDGTLSPLPPGTYRTGLLDPPVTFTVGDEWHLDLQQQDILGLGYEAYNPFFSEKGQIVSVIPVDNFRFTPAHARSATGDLAPEEFDTWPEPPEDLAHEIAAIDHLETSDVAAVEIAGIPALAFDYEVGDLPDQADGCTPGSPYDCIELLRNRDGNGYVLGEGSRGRFYVVDLGEIRFAIDVAAQADEFDRFLPFAETVIETMSFS